MRLAGMAGLVLALFALSAVAGDFEDAMRLYENRDYEKAAALFRKAAEQGDPRSQVRLGLMHSSGQGVPLDERQAASWYHKAAEQKSAKAQLFLGMRYANGRGVEVDYVEAEKWLILAGRAGVAVANSLREFLANHLTDGKAAEAQKRAHEWMRAHP